VRRRRSPRRGKERRNAEGGEKHAEKEILVFFAFPCVEVDLPDAGRREEMRKEGEKRAEEGDWESFSRPQIHVSRKPEMETPKRSELF
jgi:hypothetical protein